MILTTRMKRVIDDVTISHTISFFVCVNISMSNQWIVKGICIALVFGAIAIIVLYLLNWHHLKYVLPITGTLMVCGFVNCYRRYRWRSDHVNGGADCKHIDDFMSQPITMDQCNRNQLKKQYRMLLHPDLAKNRQCMEKATRATQSADMECARLSKGMSNYEKSYWETYSAPKPSTTPMNSQSTSSTNDTYSKYSFKSNVQPTSPDFMKERERQQRERELQQREDAASLNLNTLIEDVVSTFGLIGSRVAGVSTITALVLYELGSLVIGGIGEGLSETASAIMETINDIIA